MAYAPPDHRLLHVGVNFRNGPPKVQEFDALMNAATSWYRYANNCWLLWTGGNAKGWYEHLAPHITTEDYLYICEINRADTYGWLPKGAWDWMTNNGIR